MKEKLITLKYWIIRNRYFYLDFKQGLINLFQYFLIIWNDHDWDYAFTQKLFIFKLKRQAKYISKNERFVGWEREVEKINTVVSLLEKDLEEFYCMEYMEYYKTKWYSEPFENDEKMFELKNELISDNSPEYFLKHICAWKKVVKEFEDKDPIKICLELGRDRQQKCHDLAWELVKRNIQKWWD